MRKLVWVAIPLVMLFCAGPIRSNRESFILDAVEQSTPVFIGTVLDVVEREDALNDHLQNVSVSIIVDISLKGELQRGQNVLFKHQQAQLTGKSVLWIGAPPLFTFIRGRSYLVCLTQRTKDAYELTFPEVSAVDISAAALAAVRQLTLTDDVKANVSTILMEIKENPQIKVAPLRSNDAKQ